MFEDFAEILKSEQSNPNALLIQILGDHYEEWGLIVAVEGQDDRRFYFDFVKENCKPLSPRIFECGGKSNLLKFRQAVENYPWKTKPHFLFICDRDFDDYLGISIEGVYRTQWYSIESFFVSIDYVSYILDRACGRPLREDEKTEFLEVFSEKFRSALSFTRLVCALMCEVRAENIDADLDAISIDKIFSFDGHNFSYKRRALSEIRAELGITDTFQIHRFCSRARTFSWENYRSWLRGKLGLQMVRKAFDLSLNSVREDLRAKLPPSNFFGSEAFNLAKSFLHELEGFNAYCAAALVRT